MQAIRSLHKPGLTAVYLSNGYTAAIIQVKTYLNQPVNADEGNNQPQQILFYQQ